MCCLMAQPEQIQAIAPTVAPESMLPALRLVPCVSRLEFILESPGYTDKQMPLSQECSAVTHTAIRKLAQRQLRLPRHMRHVSFVRIASLCHYWRVHASPFG